jgi:acyl-CoA synthetase (AMP-forming)/AMP-acid ligase II
VGSQGTADWVRARGPKSTITRSQPVTSGAGPGLAGLPASVPEALTLREPTPHDPFVVGMDFNLTFGEADARSAELAGRLLAAGVGKGTRVGILYANGPEWVISWLAAARIGALVVPLSTFAPGPELGRVLQHTDVAALLTASSFLESDLGSRLEVALEGLADSSPALALEAAPYLRWIHLEGGNPPSWSRSLPPPLGRAVVRAAEQQVAPADALVMINTSGTTSGPKSVVHTHGSLIRHAALIGRLRSLGPSDRLYCPMPFFWVGGLTTSLLYALTCGCALLTQRRFEPGEALDLVERERATLIQVWPNAALAMVEHPTFDQRNLTSVRGGTVPEALPLPLRPASPDLYPGLFGMTETGGPHSNPEDPYRPLPDSLRGTFGKGVPGIERKVVDPESMRTLGSGIVGELCVRGPFMMEQMYKRERHETFDRDGWYATGDLCSLDDEGFLRSHGRKTPMIKTGGSNVAPREVEEVLAACPAVRTAYVLGVPAAAKGEEVVAVVVPADGYVPDGQELTNYVRTRLSTYKIPRRWLIVDEGLLPLLPTGKVDVQALQRLFTG